MDLQDLRTCLLLQVDKVLGEGLAPIADADIAFLSGVLRHNPHLDHDKAMAQFRARVFANSSVDARNWYGIHEESEYMLWTREWNMLAVRGGVGVEIMSV